MNLLSAICLSYILHALISSSLAIPETEFYPFGDAAGDVSLPRVLDISSPAIPLTIAGFPFFGQVHNQLFVSSIATPVTLPM